MTPANFAPSIGERVPAAWWPVALVLAVTAAYVSSFGGVFLFDDFQAITENPTIREVWRLDRVLLLPGDQAGTVGGRPVANLTLALNYAAGGANPWGYHAVNLLIHLLAVVTLFGVLRRTLAGPLLPAAVRNAAPWPVFLSALLWGLHPLQTESVTYVVQRVESLAGLFCLLTLYSFIRFVDTPSDRRWPVAAVVYCLLGMATKEVMVAAPLLVLAYDRVFAAGSWREAWRRRGRMHAALFATWIVLAVLVAGTAGRGGSAGFGTGVSPWAYLLTQAGAIVHYLRLVVWPHPLVFDYGTTVVRGLTEVFPQFLLLLALLGATGWALVRKPVLGLPGLWFFCTLAPSSSVVPVITQTMAEHRMYLPLVAVIVLVVVSLHRLAGGRVVVPLLVLAVGAGLLTHRRNMLYHDEIALWEHTVRHRPGNFRAQTTLGLMLAGQGRLDEAVRHYQAALRLAPDNAPTHLNLSAALLRLDRATEAAHHGAEAVRLEPANVNALVNLGNALAALDRTDEAIRAYEVALAREPDAPDVHLNLAAAVLKAGDAARAIRHYEQAASLSPGRAQTWFDLARAQLQAGDPPAARRAGEQALRLRPDDADTLYLLGNLAAAGEEFVAAIGYFRRAVAMAPAFVAARNNLANVLLITGQLDEAITQYREVLRQQPDDVRVQENLAHALELQQDSRRGR